MGSIATAATLEAQADNCDRSETYHAALALIGMTDDEVGHILAAHEVTREAFLAAVRRVKAGGATEVRHDIGDRRRELFLKSGGIPPSQETQKAYEVATFDIDARGARTPCHLLVGLLSVPTGIAALAFAEMSVADQLRADALRVVKRNPDA